MSDREKTLNYLKEHSLCVIATANMQGEPEAATINYFVDDDFNLFFITRKDTRKHANLLANPRVAIVVGTEPEPHTVQLQGDAVFLENEDELKAFSDALELRPELFQLYFASMRRHPIFPRAQESDVSIIRVDIRWLRWLDYDAAAMTEEYHQIIP